ncbi:trypsin-like peptidase domain-containing protein [Candidatus Uhrbacteria bacterium]|nr:trypsin-like peptidase domain-containing protein [Candidatus Uhrbacteria bacterium]
MKQALAMIVFATALIGFYVAEATVSQDQIQSVIKIYDVIFDGETIVSIGQGSGTIIDPRGYILTNYHVVDDTIENGGTLISCLTFNSRDNPVCGAVITDVVLHNKNIDLALLKIVQVRDANSNWIYFEDWVRMYNVRFPYVPINKNLQTNEGIELGSEIQILGFPAAGGESITFTKGTVSGFETFGLEVGSFPFLIKTDAKINSGNSGGAAFDSNNNFIGVPTAVAGGQGNIGYIISMPIVNLFLQDIPDVGVNSGSLTCPDMVNGYRSDDGKCYCNTGYIFNDEQGRCLLAPGSITTEAPVQCTNGIVDSKGFCHCNVGYSWSSDIKDCVKLVTPPVTLVECPEDKKLYSGVCVSMDEYCSYTSGSGTTWNKTLQNCERIEQSIENSKTLSCKAIPSETEIRAPKNLEGYILLQVESRGEAWYIHPKYGQRFYLKDGSEAYQMMRTFGVGISEKDFVLALDGNKRILSLLRGMIVLRVQSRGEAYYVHPKDLTLHYLANGEEAYKLMRLYSLGISNQNLEKIPKSDFICR